MKRYLYLLLVLSVLLLGCTAKEETKKSAEQQTNHLVLAIGSEPEQGFDPTTGWGRYGSPLFQSTLFRLNEQLEVTYDWRQII